jgi:hypothetical protein
MNGTESDPTLDPKSTLPEGGLDRARGADSVPDPRDARLAELERYYNEAQATFQKIAPYEEDVRAILDDEDYREFQRTARKSYMETREAQQKARDNELPPEYRRLLDEIDGRLKPALEEVSVLRQDREARSAREQEAAKAAQKTFVDENIQYAQRLISEQGLTSEEITDLGRFAKVLHDETVAAGSPRFVPLEEAYKRIYGRASAKKEAATPRSLRARSAAPGVPSASRAPEAPKPDPRRPGAFTDYMLGKLNAQRKTG